MAVTRADFDAIAKTLAELRPDPKHGTVGEKRIWAMTVRNIAKTLAERSGSFDSTVFFAACGYTGEGL